MMEQLTEFVNGNLTVTTHRIIWLGSSKSLACHLSVVSEVAIYTPKFFSRHRVQLVIVGNVDRPKPHFVIKLEEGRREDFISWVTKACEMKTWEQTNQSEQKENKKEQGFTTSSAGIGGIIRKQKLQIERNEKVAEEALQDLDSLMKKAKEMVVLIERYRAQVDQSAKKAEEDGEQGDQAQQDADSTELVSLLINVGIASPVTKSAAGDLFFEELARQIADFLMEGKKLQRLGGMITLPDLYCLYNRARGTELISPDDLLASAKLMSILHLPMHMRSFESGVIVIQANEFNDKTMSENLLKYISQDSNGVTAIQVSAQFKISLVIANQNLLTAEKLGYLCRDETIDGIRFFPNEFNRYFEIYCT